MSYVSHCIHRGIGRVSAIEELLQSANMYWLGLLTVLCEMPVLGNKKEKGIQVLKKLQIHWEKCARSQTAHFHCHRNGSLKACELCSLRPHPRPAESEYDFHKMPRCFIGMSKFENQKSKAPSTSGKSRRTRKLSLNCISECKGIPETALEPREVTGPTRHLLPPFTPRSALQTLNCHKREREKWSAQQLNVFVMWPHAQRLVFQQWSSGQTGPPPKVKAAGSADLNRPQSSTL